MVLPDTEDRFCSGTHSFRYLCLLWIAGFLRGILRAMKDDLAPIVGYLVSGGSLTGEDPVLQEVQVSRRKRTRIGVNSDGYVKVLGQHGKEDVFFVVIDEASPRSFEDDFVLLHLHRMNLYAARSPRPRLRIT